MDPAWRTVSALALLQTPPSADAVRSSAKATCWCALACEMGHPLCGGITPGAQTGPAGPCPASIPAITKLMSCRTLRLTLDIGLRAASAP